MIITHIGFKHNQMNIFLYLTHSNDCDTVLLHIQMNMKNIEGGRYFEIG